MTDAEKQKMISDVLMKSFKDNTDFQKVITDNAKKQQEILNQEIEKNKNKCIIDKITDILGNGITFWEAFSLAIFVLISCNVLDWSYLTMLIPLAIPYALVIIMVVFSWLFSKKEEKKG